MLKNYMIMVKQQEKYQNYYDIKDFRDLYKNDLKLLREVKPWLK